MRLPAAQAASALSYCALKAGRRRTASVAEPRCPAAKGFGGERQQSVELLHEPGKHPADFGDDFVRMRAHQAARVHDHTVALGSQA